MLNTIRFFRRWCVGICFLPIFVFGQSKDVVYLHKIHSDYTHSVGKTWKAVTNSVAPVTFGISAGWLVTGIATKDSSTIAKGLTNLGAQCINAVVTTSLKLGIQRDRPFVSHPDLFTKYAEAGAYSFPSAHTSMAFALATSLSIAYPKWYVIVPAYLYAGAIGYSRMYLGVHYPSDVLSGALIGAGSAVAAHYLFKKINRWADHVAPSIVRRIYR